MFRVTDANGDIIRETDHRPTAEQSKLQYEASMGKKATLIDLNNVVEPKKAPAKTEQVSVVRDQEESVSDR